jgi:ankyrin repeat protein
MRVAATVLITLAWSIPAFCGEIEKAIKKGDVEQVKALIEANPSLISKKFGLLGDMPLAIAAMDCQKDVAKLLLDHNAEVDAKDHLGFTPLHQAASFGCKDVAQLLLVHGANVNAKNKSGETPLWLAKNGRHTDVANVLRLFGASK